VVFLADTALPPRRARNVEHVLWDVQWKLVISDGKTSAARRVRRIRWSICGVTYDDVPAMRNGRSGMSH
jgi:hypothetical protein